jgi:small-conductance mechanosensitive channel
LTHSDVEQFLQFRWWAAEDWSGLAATLGPPLARAFVLAIITWYAAGIARASFERATRRTGADASLRLLIGRLVYLAVVALGVVTILDVFGVPLSALVTIVGVIGLGISLALQDILKNFFAGTYLLFERPFRIGDEISVKDHRGIVETVGIRTTTLRTADNVQVLIPNAMVFSDVVLNRTYERPRDATPTEETDSPTTDVASPSSQRADRQLAGGSTAPASFGVALPVLPDIGAAASVARESVGFLWGQVARCLPTRFRL